MALVPCPKCNNQISNKAERCPRCGYMKPTYDLAKLKKVPKKRIILIITLIILLIAGAASVLVWIDTNNSQKYKEEHNKYVDNLHTYRNAVLKYADLAKDLWAKVEQKENEIYEQVLYNIRNNIDSYDAAEVREAFYNQDDIVTNINTLKTGRTTIDFTFRSLYYHPKNESLDQIYQTAKDLHKACTKYMNMVVEVEKGKTLKEHAENVKRCRREYYELKEQLKKEIPSKIQ